MKATEVQAKIKGALKEWLPKDANSAVWELSKSICNNHTAAVKLAKAEVKELLETPKEVRKMLTDEERTEELTKFLDSKLIDGTLSAAELAQFKDIYGLKAKDRDVTIGTISFKEALPESYERIELVKKVIEEEIRCVNTNNNP